MSPLEGKCVNVYIGRAESMDGVAPVFALPESGLFRASAVGCVCVE